VSLHLSPAVLARISDTILHLISQFCISGVLTCAAYVHAMLSRPGGLSPLGD
jgi:hypothetical protein